MSLEAAAKIGLEIFKHRQEIGTVLKGAGDFLKSAQATKVADRFATRLADRIADKTSGVDAAALMAGGGSVSNATAFLQLQAFDANKDGSVSREELTQGLETATDAGVKALGQTMLKNYDKAALLDGKDGVSIYDLAKVAGTDGRMAHLSAADWSAFKG